MRKLRHRIFFAFAGLALLQGTALSGEASPKTLTGSLETVDGLKVLRLWGSPRERGYAQGWLMASEILDGVEQGFSFFFGGSSAPYVNRVLPMVVGGAFAFDEDEIAELEGLAEGIRARFPERALAFLGRPLTVDDLKVLNTFGDWYALGCSSAAVWGRRTPEGKTAVVRNFDFMRMDLAVVGQHVRVVAPRQGAQGWVGIGHAGSIGAVTAMNGSGVVVAIHDVPVRPNPTAYLRRNVPRLIALRRLVERLPAEGAVEKAEELCRSWSTLFGNNFLVATPAPRGGLPAGVLEYDSREERDGGVSLRGPEEAKDGEASEYVACSNHHRLRGSGKCGRYSALVSGCAEGPAVFDLPALVALAERAAVPRPGIPVFLDGAPTLHQAVARTGERRLWVRMVGKDQADIREARGVDLGVRELLASLPEAPPAGPPVRTATVATHSGSAEQPGASPPSPAPILLWPDGAPGEDGSVGEEKDTTKPTDALVSGKPVIRLGNVSRPTIAVYPPPRENDTGAAVVVCPGGGYHILAMDLEGTEVVEWLNSIGVTGVLLKYRVPARKGGERHRAPLQDAQRALGIVRDRAAEWGIDPRRIGILGFSAGAHLAAALSSNYEKRTYEPVDAADELSCRPDFVVLVYPAYLTVKEEGDRIASELKVTSATPPTFLAQTQDDGVRVETSVFYYLALKNAKVPVEMHLYPSGGHGYGLRPSGGTATTWPGRVEDWMGERGFLERKD